ncbi:hypothetical protein [Streptomyces sp. NPDC007088]|uniref:hypothetical protein n=1 Tax=Streptomyces sp. NPDC007088 TaxID=3364773 RepID=UPI00369CFD36
MARSRGGDDIKRKKGRGPASRLRQVYIFAEGEVSELEYIDIVMKSGTPLRQDERVNHHFENANDPTKSRKPLPLVKKAGLRAGGFRKMVLRRAGEKSMGSASSRKLERGP